MSRASRGKAGESLVEQELSKIALPHIVLNDVTFVEGKTEMSHQVDHILVHPYGVFVIETKNYYGTIEIDPMTGAWFKTIKGRKERIFNPLNQNKSHARIIYKYLNGKVPVIPVVVYAKDNQPYLPDDNVIGLSDLIPFIEAYPYSRIYSEAQMKRIQEILESHMADVSNKEHVQNIRIMKQVRKEKEYEMTYAIERGICPRCGAKIKEKNFVFECTKCDFRFKL